MNYFTSKRYKIILTQHPMFENNTIGNSALAGIIYLNRTQVLKASHSQIKRKFLIRWLTYGKYPHISMGTVYRNLNRLVESRKVTKLSFSHEADLFALEGSRQQNLTTAYGRPVENDQSSIAAGSKTGYGYGLLNDTHLVEKLAHFTRERIPSGLFTLRAPELTVWGLQLL